MHADNYCNSGALRVFLVSGEMRFYFKQNPFYTLFIYLLFITRMSRVHNIQFPNWKYNKLTDCIFKCNTLSVTVIQRISRSNLTDYISIRWTLGILIIYKRHFSITVNRHKVNLKVIIHDLNLLKKTQFVICILNSMCYWAYGKNINVVNSFIANISTKKCV